MNKPARPATPCIAVCSTGMGDDVCRGCGRTFVEVSQWVMMTDEERGAVFDRLEAHWAKAGLPPPWLARGV
ncbi:DUF1289 domain-containing protein [Silvimonas iriomotensis]|nr:DUF1289 domain-containing protein [Silvimonas iriomotensis]